MNIDTHLPCARLMPFIRAYKIIESSKNAVNRVLPETSAALAFRYKGQVSYIQDGLAVSLPSSVVSGLRTSVRLINYAEDTAAIIVVFNEGGAAAFFREPLHELFEESISLDTLIGREKIALIEERLAEATFNKERIAIIENFLLSILLNRKQDSLISGAIQKIQAEQGVLKMNELAKAFYLSQDAFEKRFRKIVGTSPKQFSSIVRLRSIVNSDLPKADLPGIAFDAGYFDQPHFNKDFKRFTGLTPTDFFNAASFW